MNYWQVFSVAVVCSCLYVACSGREQPSGVKVADLRCQALENPVGVDEHTPRFSWRLEADNKGVRQTAYQIMVASSKEQLAKHPDLWNSGKVMSDQNTFVVYDGKPLHSAQKYYWKVKVWTNKGQGEYEQSPGTFVTGLFKESEWAHARWIGYEKLPEALKVFPGVHGNGDQLGKKAVKRAVIPRFFKAFQSTKDIKEAFLYTSGQGQAIAYLNGEKMGTGFLEPAWSDYTKRCYYNSYEVTSLLKKGNNTLAAIVGMGFLYINRERYRKLVIAAGYPMLRLQLIIRYTDGTADTIATDKSWKTAPSAITYSSIYGGEDFDARRKQSHWTTLGFQGENGQQAIEVPGPGGRMDAQEMEPVVIDSVFRPVYIDSSVSQYRMYDFGQNASGMVRLKAAGPKGYTLRIIPAELIDKDNKPDQKASGQPYYWSYTFNGEGTERWVPAFTYYGFRYAGIEVFNPEGKQVDISQIHIDSLWLLHTRTGTPRVGDFQCSDTLFNQIFALIRWGIANNMSNVATDCPHREKLGWLEETHLIGNSMQYNYDIQRFYSKIITDMKDAQLANGLVPDIAPEYVIFDGGFRDSPEWGSACILAPWYVYQWYGNKEILQQSYAMMKKYVGYLSQKADAYLLSYGLGDWYDLGPKHPGVSQLTPLGVTATAFYYYDAKVLAQVASLLHHEEDALKYGKLAESVKRAFNQKYFNPTTKVYATGSQTAYAIPLYFDIVPEGDRAAILENLVDSIRQNNFALTAGDIGFRYLVQTLEQGGYPEILYKMNNREDVPGYGYQIRKGATALTESWQALRNVSNDHMMLGHLMEWFYSGLAGIGQQKGSVGYKQIKIAPQFVQAIDWVDCSYESINGLIHVRWERSGAQQIRLQVTIPANTTAQIVLPAETKEIGSGQYTFNVPVSR